MLGVVLLLAVLASDVVGETDAPSSVRSGGPGGTRTGNYLIIAATDYVSTAPLTQFINAKTAMGFDVSVYDVPAGTSRSAIKTYIESLWGTPDAPEYILIVGDTDGSSSTSNTIPHWVGGGSSSATTDLPYACMDGGDDWYPNIAIGRFSVRNEAHLQAIVDKTLCVEAGVFLDPEYVTHATFLASSDLDSGAHTTHDWVIDTYMDPANFQSNKIYGAEGGDTADVTAAVNAGTLFLVYGGHSTSSGWWNPAFSPGDISALNNEGLYGLVYGWSCNTAHFDYDECFGETWIREANKGAAAYLSASTYIFYGGSAWESSRRLEKYFFQSFFEDGTWEVGPAWQKALSRLLSDPDYGPSHSHTRNLFEMNTLLGDPSLLLPQPAGMRVAPGTGMESEGQSGGPFTPNSTTYTVTNNTDGAITYSVTADQTWVDIDNGSGVLPVGDEAEVIVSLTSEAESFGDGHYEAAVEFINTTTHEGDTVRMVILDVGVPAPSISFPMDSDPEWSTEGLWEFGQPTGGGGEYGEHDPTAGYTGDNVYGYNLDGDYENNLPETHLTSGAIDCTNLSGVELKFQRWLGVEQPTYDHAYVRVSNDGTNWVNVWSNSSTISDSTWVLQEFDISAVADGQPTVYLRWTMGTTDHGWRYCGWNIDDVEIWAVQAQSGSGDFDEDGDVDLVDFRAFQECFGHASTGVCAPGDITGGGVIDLDDFTEFVAVMGGPSQD